MAEEASTVQELDKVEEENEGDLEAVEDVKLEHKKDSILLDTNATPHDILRKYYVVKDKNDEQIKRLLLAQERISDANTMTTRTNRPQSKKIKEEPPDIVEKEWEIIPSYLTLYTPYMLLDTVDLKPNFSDERKFKIQDVQNPRDWKISVLPETGILSSKQNISLLIICEPKKSAFPQEQSKQEGIIKINVQEEIKELVICINYILTPLGKWISCKAHPRRRPSPKAQIIPNNKNENMNKENIS